VLRDVQNGVEVGPGLPRGCGCQSSRPQGGPECRTIEPASRRVGRRWSFVVSWMTGCPSRRQPRGGTFRSRRVWEWVRRWRAASADARESLACLVSQSPTPLACPDPCRGGAADLRVAPATSIAGWDRLPFVIVREPDRSTHRKIHNEQASLRWTPRNDPRRRWSWLNLAPARP
jgi:hypothetical protein